MCELEQKKSKEAYPFFVQKKVILEVSQIEFQNKWSFWRCQLQYKIRAEGWQQTKENNQ